MDERYEKAKRFAVKVFCFAAAGGIIYIFAKYIWKIVLPFIIAYIFAECFKPLVKRSEGKRNLRTRFLVLLAVLVSAFSILTLLYAAAREILNEIGKIAENLSGFVAKIRDDEEYAGQIIEKIGAVFPFFDVKPKLWEIRADLDDRLWEFGVKLTDKFSGGMIGFIGDAAAFLPSALLTCVVTIVSAYYFAVDRKKINAFFASLIPKKQLPKVKKAKDELGETVGKFIRAYGLIFLITFSELFISFLIIGVDYAFVIALVTAIVDILPIVGTGTVLIPWGIIEIASGRYGRGTALLLVYAVITVIRQVAEPKIIGKFTGVSPMTALASMYAGLKLFGLTGLILFPLGAILFKRLREDQLRQSTSETLMTSGSEERADTSL